MSLPPLPYKTHTVKMDLTEEESFLLLAALEAYQAIIAEKYKNQGSITLARVIEKIKFGHNASAD